MDLEGAVRAEEAVTVVVAAAMEVDVTVAEREAVATLLVAREKARAMVRELVATVVVRVVATAAVATAAVATAAVAPAAVGP